MHVKQTIQTLLILFVGFVFVGCDKFGLIRKNTNNGEATPVSEPISSSTLETDAPISIQAGQPFEFDLSAFANGLENMSASAAVVKLRSLSSLEGVSLVISTPPQHGTATLNGFRLTYVPDEFYTGSDSLTLTASKNGRSRSKTFAFDLVGKSVVEEKKVSEEKPKKEIVLDVEKKILEEVKKTEEKKVVEEVKKTEEKKVEEIKKTEVIKETTPEPKVTKPLATKLVLTAPDSIEATECIAMTLKLQNDLGQAASFYRKSGVSLRNSTTYFVDSNCSENVSDLIFDLDESEKTFYFRIKNIANGGQLDIYFGAWNIIQNPDGSDRSIELLAIKKVVTTLTPDVIVLSNTMEMALEDCALIPFNLARNYMTALVGEPSELSFTASSGNFFTDSACTTKLASNKYTFKESSYLTGQVFFKPTKGGMIAIEASFKLLKGKTEIKVLVPPAKAGPMTQLKLNKFEYTYVWYCHRIEVSALDVDGLVTNAKNDTVISLAVKNRTGPMREGVVTPEELKLYGKFYTDNYCSSPPITSIKLQKGNNTVEFYLAEVAVTFETLELASVGLTTTTYPIEIEDTSIDDRVLNYTSMDYAVSNDGLFTTLHRVYGSHALSFSKTASERFFSGVNAVLNGTNELMHYRLDRSKEAGNSSLLYVTRPAGEVQTMAMQRDYMPHYNAVDLMLFDRQGKNTKNISIQGMAPHFGPYDTYVSHSMDGLGSTAVLLSELPNTTTLPNMNNTGNGTLFTNGRLLWTYITNSKGMLSVYKADGTPLVQNSPFSTGAALCGWTVKVISNPTLGGGVAFCQSTMTDQSTYFRRFNASGAWIDANPVSLGVTRKGTSDTARFGAAMSSSGDFVFSYYIPDGAGTPGPNTPHSMVWDTTAGEVRVVFVSSTGGVLRTVGKTPFSMAASMDSLRSPLILNYGNDFLVSWEGLNKINYLAKYDAKGNLLSLLSGDTATSFISDSVRSTLRTDSAGNIYSASAEGKIVKNALSIK